MKPILKVAISLTILIALLFLFYYSAKTISNVTGKSIFGWLIKDSNAGNLDNFARCLYDEKIIMYGSAICPHCKNQKALFGNSFQYINYIECAENPEACAILDGVPAWWINGEIIYGTQSIEQLSKLSGCKI